MASIEARLCLRKPCQRPDFKANPGCLALRATAIILRLGRAVICGFSLDQVQRVLNSLAANRRLAFLVVAIQAAMAALVALAFLTQDASAAVAAAIGGGAMALGSLILAWWSTKGLAYSAGHVLVRLTTGIALKWFVVFSMLYLAFVRFGLPPLPLLVGLVATTASSFLVYKLKA